MIYCNINITCATSEVVFIISKPSDSLISIYALDCFNGRKTFHSQTKSVSGVSVSVSQTTDCNVPVAVSHCW